jgi:hypothetical protein
MRLVVAEGRTIIERRRTDPLEPVLNSPEGRLGPVSSVQLAE